MTDTTEETTEIQGHGDQSGGDQSGKKRPRGEEQQDMQNWVPCNFTQETLINLTIVGNKEIWGTYFFKNAKGTKTFPPRDDLDDDDVRCKGCGGTIHQHKSNPQHTSTAATVALKWESDLYKSVLEAKITDVPHNGKAFKILTRAAPWFGVAGAAKDELLVRQWHEDFWEAYSSSLCKPQHRVLIVGTPGIGKTVALNYFLYQYIKAAADPQLRQSVALKRYVMLILPNNWFSFIFDTDKREAAAFELKDFADVRSFGLKNTFYLHDLGKSSPLLSHDDSAVLASSPDREKYNEFMKNGLPRFFYAPLFTDDEMNFIAQRWFPNHDYSAAWPKRQLPCQTWRDAAWYLGNVPRYVFSDEYIDISTRLEDKLKNFNSTDLAIVGEVFHPRASNISDTLLEIAPGVDPATEKLDYRELTVSFRKGHVLQYLDDMINTKWLANAANIMDNTNIGNLFEVAVHGFLVKYPSGLSMSKIVSLSGDTTSNIAALWSFAPGDKLAMTHFSSVTTSVSLENKRYYRPESGNFPVIDSFVFFKRNIVCLQMTIAKQHAPTVSKVKQFVDEFVKTFRYNDQPVMFDAANGKICTTGPTPLELVVHVVYIMQTMNFPSFKKQGIVNDVKDGSNDAYVRFWNRVKQYKSPPPRNT